MSATANPAAVEDVQPAIESRRGLLRRELLRNPQAIIGLTILGIFVLVALLSPVLLSEDPKTKVGSVFEHPSSAHVLGTDGGGADMLALLVGGAPVSLIVGFAAAAVSALIG